MCGIAGTLGRLDLDIEVALDRIAHRGPDGRGIIEIRGAVHGHVRLAIQDPLPRSGQPFVYGDVTLSYVGELWNAAEVRNELETLGYVFDTTGDTEVLAAALDRWGAEALERVDGMFALAWSSSEGTFLARDRFGKVPLYLFSSDDLWSSGFAWASERRAFGARAIEATAVPPGCYGRLSLGMRWERYYALPEVVSYPERPAEAVRDMLEAGVTRRLVSDVPVCCLISGGLDSALILELIRRAVPHIVAYHAWHDPASSDRSAARRFCEEREVELREVFIPTPTPDAVREAVSVIEVPMKAQVEIALLCLPLAQRIREDGFRVVFSGEAADEIFGGYGNLARRSGSDITWRKVRVAAVDKMARGNFCRVNKVFMAHGVEGRLPFMERDLVELVLGLGVLECPPNKTLLKEAARGIVPDWILSRPKETFQGESGIIAACAALYKSPLLAYNEYARGVFGGIPRS